ncbi:helix-turn-helix domain-containing protein [Streptomyces violens]|uniref:helix-turn-helix domain-containing protein n=1 Tax=Streptomyces violens TaxID=66377 RepID=UPI0004BE791E|nr:helix-turn-helix transcriptional regulator [Streptomyces violens]
MPKPKQLDPSLSPRALYGAELRFKRESAGLTQAELGAPMFVSGSFIGQLESGARRMQGEYARRIDEILGTDGFFERNVEAAQRSRYPEHFADAAEFEAMAISIREYAPLLVPGLLQTEDYARAVFRAVHPVAPEGVIDDLLSARLDRARVLEDPTTPLFWAVLDENVLRRPVGGPAAMHTQLAHIAALMRRNRVIVQVLPYAEGAHAALEGSLKLMTFADAPPVAYLQGLATGQMLDEPSHVERYGLAYDLVRAAALSPEASLVLIESAAKDYHDGY